MGTGICYASVFPKKKRIVRDVRWGENVKTRNKLGTGICIEIVVSKRKESYGMENEG
jgi:hypothetical protein